MFNFPFSLFVIWFLSCLVEINQTPFDFAYGESKLVFEFNVYYCGVGFELIFWTIILLYWQISGKFRSRLNSLFDKAMYTSTYRFIPLNIEW